MSALDIFVILLLGGGALVGFVRGFVHEVLSLFAWIVAIAMLKLFHTQLSVGLTDTVGTPAGAAVVAFALLFIPSFLLVKLLAKSIGGRTRKSMLGPVDRVLGIRPEWMTNSRTYPLLNASGLAIVDWVEQRRLGTTAA